MFTGLVEARGTIVERKPMVEGYRLRVATPFADELREGDSVAVNGVCVTALAPGGGEVHADIGPETARITTLGTLERGQAVNLERALRLDARVGGHLVLGHVDGVGSVEDVRHEGESLWLTIAFPGALAAFFVRKGSITVDGVSLTVAGLGRDRFDVQVIPHTAHVTTLGQLKTGDHVNLECDMVGKYIVRALELRDGHTHSLP